MLNTYATKLTIKDNGGDDPRPWSEISYTVTVNMPTKAGSACPVDIDGVQSHRRRSDDLADVVPAPVGSEHDCNVANGYITAYIDEEWYMAECTAAAASSSRAAEKKILVRRSGGGVATQGSANPSNPGDGGSGTPGGGTTPA